MPTLTFTEGDTAEIHVHNRLRESTSLHWHGLYLPNKEDGVPYLTQMPIEPNTTHVYRFPIIQNGTHWYHSHSGPVQNKSECMAQWFCSKEQTTQLSEKALMICLLCLLF